jgi:hypothetical protein
MLWNLTLFILIISSQVQAAYQPREGDILFQHLNSAFGGGVQDATGSHWSHVGIVKEKSDGFYVIEAVFTGVRQTHLSHFLRGCKFKFAAIRPQGWTELETSTFVKRALSHLGKPYDRVFDLGDLDEIYCSELIYDALHKARGKNSLKSSPMDFSNALPFWKSYFKRLQTLIPQGKPGISPEAVFQYQNASLIYHYKWNAKPRKRIFEALYTKGPLN